MIKSAQKRTSQLSMNALLKKNFKEFWVFRNKRNMDFTYLPAIYSQFYFLLEEICLSVLQTTHTD